jgi:NTP pyrophosphatase (non-canonical NTP hydrolase)
MAILKKQPTLKDFQEYIIEIEKERGFKTDVLSNCLMLGEEVGELFKAIRKQNGFNKLDANSKYGLVDEELADVFIFILAIANKCGIDLEKAFRNKEEANHKRVWK